MLWPAFSGGTHVEVRQAGDRVNRTSNCISAFGFLKGDTECKVFHASLWFLRKRAINNGGHHFSPHDTFFSALVVFRFGSSAEAFVCVEETAVGSMNPRLWIMSC